MYISISLFAYLSFSNNPNIKFNNIFAFDLPKNFFSIFLAFGVAFSMLLTMIISFKPTKDLMNSY